MANTYAEEYKNRQKDCHFKEISRNANSMTCLTYQPTTCIKSCLFLSNNGLQLLKFANSTEDGRNEGGYLLLVLFVPDSDISPSLQQQLTDAWMTHLGCQHQRCPAILERNQRHINKYDLALRSTITWMPKNRHQHKEIKKLDWQLKIMFHLKAKKQYREYSFKWTKGGFIEYRLSAAQTDRTSSYWLLVTWSKPLAGIQYTFLQWQLNTWKMKRIYQKRPLQHTVWN